MDAGSAPPYRQGARMTIVARAWFVIAITVVACRGKGPTETDSGTHGAASSSASPRPWPSNAPPATACATHDDCTVITWDGPSPPDPCCDARVGYKPVAQRYLAFMQAYRKTHCAGVTCPDAPLPGAEPACCAGKARCIGGQCKSGCDDPTATYPKVSVLDPACRLSTPPPAPP